MSYKVIKKFGMFEYNPKTRGSRIVWRDIGDRVGETTVRRMTDPHKYVQSN